MYKVIIADDEDLIREGLKTFVDWSGMGFFIDGEAADGNKAFELVTERMPHVLLTDIKMPFCTGIKLMEKMRNNGCDVQIVVLSGYDEFEYARAALEAGARGYLLKPIKLDKLRELFLKIKFELDRSFDEERKKEEAYKLLEEEFILHLVQGRAGDRAAIAAKAGRFGIVIAHSGFGVLIAEADAGAGRLEELGEAGMDTLLSGMRQAALESGRKLGDAYVFPCGARSVGLLIGGDFGEETRLASAAREWRGRIKDGLGITVTVGVSGVRSDPGEIGQACAEASRRLERKFMVGNDRVIDAEDDSGAVGASSGEAPRLNTDRIVSVIRAADRLQADRYLDSLFSGLHTRDAVYELYYQILRFVIKYVEKNDIPYAHLARLRAIRYPDLARFETRDAAAREAKSIIGAIVDAVAGGEGKSGHRLVEEVKRYVETHYAEAISLESASERIRMHPMYVSKLFKRETGVNFIDFVTEVRVDRAKELLRNLDLKVYEISLAVGYYDSKHFSKVFKNMAGVTPREYRKIALGLVDDTFE